jgi:NarL family two-component system response regulator LiaR
MTINLIRTSSPRPPGTLGYDSASASTTPSVRVLIVDDHEMVRRGLVTFLGLAPDILVVGQTGRGAEAAELARRLQPDVVLMDLVMPHVDGLTAMRATREAAPDARIIALTSFHANETVMQALEAGAISYLIKDIGAMGLADAVRAAHAGRSTLCAEAAQALIKHNTAAKITPGRAEELTRREHEVLQLMVRGLSNPQIAARLVVSRATANFHVSRVLGKLGAPNRSKAVALALRDGLVTASAPALSVDAA